MASSRRSAAPWLLLALVAGAREWGSMQLLRSVRSAFCLRSLIGSELSLSLVLKAAASDKRAMRGGSCPPRAAREQLLCCIAGEAPPRVDSKGGGAVSPAAAEIKVLQCFTPVLGGRS